MRGPKIIVRITGILLLLALDEKICNALCNLPDNGTTARCYDLEDARYIERRNLEILKSPVSSKRLHAGALRDMENLRNLDLSNGHIRDIEAGAFINLSKLRSLDLSHNNITYLGPKSLDGLTNLRNLNLRRNHLDTIPQTVMTLKSLKSLDLTGNPLRCDCANLKIRDSLLSRGVHLSRRVLCSSPRNLRGRALLQPEVTVICMFEEQDSEMQMDEAEGSGEVKEDDDDFEDLPVNEKDEYDEDESSMLTTPNTVEIETAAGAISSMEESGDNPSSTIATITNDPLEKMANNEEMFFTEDIETRGSTTTTIATSAVSKVNVVEEKTRLTIEGSGEKVDDNEEMEGSGIDGSGTGVPPIIWDVPDDETNDESSSSESPARTTEAGLLDTIWGLFWSTPTVPEEDAKKEMGPEDEEFLKVSTEMTPVSSEKTPVNEDIVVTSNVPPSEVSSSKEKKLPETNDDAVKVASTLGDAKLGKVKADDATVDSGESADASATRQPKKGMGSYVVLAALLAVLGGLIGFAAYKGDFCRKRRKRNDPERGTELKDMRKSLLEAGNGSAQPKIASNGNLENVPLVVASSVTNDEKYDGKRDTTMDTRYTPVTDTVDPIKPPRKSFVSCDETPTRIITNGNDNSVNQRHSNVSAEIAEPVCLRKTNEPTVNGKNRHHHESVSSIGTESRDSPSIRTSARDSTPTDGSQGTLQGLTRPPLSPGAQRVKITLQENPDSVPKTPILITRTKTGENLVKTP